MFTVEGDTDAKRLQLNATWTVSMEKNEHLGVIGYFEGDLAGIKKYVVKLTGSATVTADNQTDTVPSGVYIHSISTDAMTKVDFSVDIFGDLSDVNFVITSAATSHGKPPAASSSSSSSSESPSGSSSTDGGAGNNDGGDGGSGGSTNDSFYPLLFMYIAGVAVLLFGCYFLREWYKRRTAALPRFAAMNSLDTVT
eukprot:TRINITY_DN6653_c0_g1_i1.p1 TRINITY_DN6653_c0_g1~~TRINITY_DN6653_c0_g1_i1.p1  ORF type:complete len:196 (-),score=33.77 TRINITY_DN6653_c0_g1_i1:26-613(-)